MEDDHFSTFASSSAASSSSSSSSFLSSDTVFTKEKDSSFSSFLWNLKKEREEDREVHFVCAYCGYAYNRLEYAHGTCSPECALTYCRTSSNDFDAVYANLLSRFSRDQDYFPCPIPEPSAPKEDEEQQDYAQRCTIQCYGNSSGRERTVRENALQYALSVDIRRENK